MSFPFNLVNFHFDFRFFTKVLSFSFLFFSVLFCFFSNVKAVKNERVKPDWYFLKNDPNFLIISHQISLKLFHIFLIVSVLYLDHHPYKMLWSNYADTSSSYFTKVWTLNMDLWTMKDLSQQHFFYYDSFFATFTIFLLLHDNAVLLQVLAYLKTRLTN